MAHASSSLCTRRCCALVLFWSLSACSTIPHYETLDLTDSAVLPSVEVRVHLGEAESGSRMFVAAGAIGAEGADGGSLEAGQRVSLGGTVLDGPAEWSADFELRCATLALGVQLPLESLFLETWIGVAGVGALVDLRSGSQSASEELDFTGLALGASLSGPIVDWLDWRATFDVAASDDSTLTRVEALVSAQPVRFLRVQAGVGTVQFERSDVGGSDIELGLTGPRLGIALHL